MKKLSYITYGLDSEQLRSSRVILSAAGEKTNGGFTQAEARSIHFCPKCNTETILGFRVTKISNFTRAVSHCERCGFGVILKGDVVANAVSK